MIGASSRRPRSPLVERQEQISVAVDGGLEHQLVVRVAQHRPPQIRDGDRRRDRAMASSSSPARRAQPAGGLMLRPQDHRSYCTISGTDASISPRGAIRREPRSRRTSPAAKGGHEHVGVEHHLHIAGNIVSRHRLAIDVTTSLPALWSSSRAHCRSTAPVALLAAVVIFLAAASISASVSVWSGACSRTATASDLRPSPRPAPS